MMSFTPVSEGDPKRKTISPYDLTSGDNPGAMIFTDEWEINLHLALSSRKKFGFVDGTIAKPSDDSPNLEDWIVNNYLLVGWIKQTIEPKFDQRYPPVK